MYKKIAAAVILALITLWVVPQAKVLAYYTPYQPLGTSSCGGAERIIDGITVSGTTCSYDIIYGTFPNNGGSTVPKYAHFDFTGFVSSAGSGNYIELRYSGVDLHLFSDVVTGLTGTALTTVYATVPTTALANTNCDGAGGYSSGCGLEWFSPSHDTNYVVDGIGVYFDDNATSSAALDPNAPAAVLTPLYTSTTLSACGVDVGCILTNVFGIDTRTDQHTFTTLINLSNTKVPFNYINAALSLNFSATGTTSAVPNIIIPLDDPGNPMVYHGLPSITWSDVGSNGIVGNIAGIFKALVTVLLWFSFIFYLISRTKHVLPN